LQACAYPGKSEAWLPPRGGSKRRRL